MMRDYIDTMKYVCRCALRSARQWQCLNIFRKCYGNAVYSITRYQPFLFLYVLVNVLYIDRSFAFDLFNKSNISSHPLSVFLLQAGFNG